MSTNTVHVTAATFEAEVLDAAMPVVIDFWAPWCGPCKALGPVIEDLASEYDGKVKVVKINVDDEQQLAGSFGVRGIPAVYALNNGDVVDVQVGFRGPKDVSRLFEKLTALKAA